MTHRLRHTTLLIVLFALTSAGWAQDATNPGTREIDVATINLYVGADFSPVLTLDPSDPDYIPQLLAGVATIYGHILQSDFHARADALAREIVKRGPDLVGLQEVTLIRRQIPGDGGTTPATEPHIDYLDTLMKALHRHGGHYAVVAEVQDADVEVPLMTGPSDFVDLRLTDRDVILARTDLPPGQFRTFNPLAGNYEARIQLPTGITVLRGWCSIDVQVRGRQFRFINTHLEGQLPPPVLSQLQLAQAVELLNGPANTTLPVILAGDFNSDANGNYSSQTYAMLTTSGAFKDSGPATGLTWGHDAFLSDPTALLQLRLDLILFRGAGLTSAHAEIVDPVISPIPPMWFSDHAGVFGTMTIQ